MLAHSGMVNANAIEAAKIVDHKAAILEANLRVMPRDPPIIHYNIVGDMAANLRDLTLQSVDLLGARLPAATAQTQNRLGHRRCRCRLRRICCRTLCPGLGRDW